MGDTELVQVISPQWVLTIIGTALALLFGPRKWVLPLILVVTAFFSYQNHVFILGLNFFPARMLLLIAWTRILARREYPGLQLVPLDKAWILYCCWSVITETLQRGGAGFIYGVANRLYDGLGTYFLIRICLQDAKMPVLRQLITCLGVICSILAAFMLVEYLTHRNWLEPLGAVFQTVQERAGRMRCQATFLHPVLAGTYGAVLLPLFAACWWQSRMRKLAVAGCLASTIMVITAGSGGPFMTFAAILGALFLWPLRANLRPIRWTVVVTLLFLHLVMKAPVWALIARLQVVAGSSSYHRYLLIDAFIRHIGDWWLIGTQNTGDWGFETDDVANQFCIAAKHAGLLGLFLFIRVLSAGFREVGLARWEAESDRSTEIMVWAFGASLFGHAVSFFGTSYFDQTIVLWHFTLAMLASLTVLTSQPAEVAELEVLADCEPIREAPIAKLFPSA